MNTEEIPDFSKFVEYVGKQVSPDDIDTYERLRKIEDISYKNRAFITAWEKQQEQERKTRKNYAKWLLSAVVIQAILLNIFFFLIGFGVIVVAEWTATAFILGVFAEITAMTTIIVRHLFPRRTWKDDDISRILADDGREVKNGYRSS